MEQNEKNLTSLQSTPEPSGKKGEKGEKKESQLSLRLCLLFSCVLVAVAILLTYTFTAAALRKDYTQKLEEQKDLFDKVNASGSQAANNLRILEEQIRHYSYYADTMDGQKMLEAAFKAYVAASGDRYAAYYTEAEFLAMMQEEAGQTCGIGITVKQTELTVGEARLKVFEILHVNSDSPSMEAGLKQGDMIYAIKSPEGSFEEITDYKTAADKIKGKEGETVGLRIYRPVGTGLEALEFSVMRKQFEIETVTSALWEQDASVGIIRISTFDLKTPKQFKTQVNALKAKGVQHFIFDVRGNPGGNLQSIKAVLSYFLNSGDLILKTIDRNGNVANQYCAEPMALTGDYVNCSVKANEIGMYKDLDCTVLCDSRTASAAEVFTATLLDYGLAKAVGETTFGKGIMQTTQKVELQGMTGYIKYTTHAYVTKRNESYHGKGIEPDFGVELPEEAKKYDISALPQALDTQLQYAAALLLGTH